MEVFFHEATQPISGDILHQWQNIVSGGQSAGMSARLANTSFHPEETKAKKARLPFIPKKCPAVRANLENLFLQWSGPSSNTQYSPC